MDEAIACNLKAIELDPKLAAAYTNLGSALSGKGQLDEAIACYRKAIELDPKLAAAHTNLGLALQDKGQVDEAIACHRKAIELDPKYAMAHTNLGIALASKGQVDEAIALYRKAIELKPKSASAHNSLGNALADKGQVDEAIALYRKPSNVTRSTPRPIATWVHFWRLRAGSLSPWRPTNGATNWEANSPAGATPRPSGFARPRRKPRWRRSCPRFSKASFSPVKTGNVWVWPESARPRS